MVPVDLGSQQLVGLVMIAHRFETHERGEPLLPKAELTLDLALGLGIFGDEVADAEATQSALELRQGVGIAGLARFVAEEAEAVGIEVPGQAVGGENLPNMVKVGEGGFRFDEASSDDEAGGVVNRQGEDLEPFAGPPLMRGTVMLEEIAIAFSLPSAARFGTALERFAQKFRHAPANVFADVGGGSPEVETADKFIGQEAEVGGLAGGKGCAQEGVRFIWPRGGVIAS